MRKPRRIGEPADTSRRDLARRGRQTIPRWSSIFGLMPYAFIPRRNYQQYDVSRFEHSTLTASMLLQILPDINSDFGLALWNYLRLGSSGFNYTAKDAAGQVDSAGKTIMDRFYPRINRDSGGLHNLIIQWLMSGFLQGAVCGEAVIEADGQGLDDLVVVDPSTIAFSRDELQRLVPKFMSPNAGIIDLNTELFWYIPIDPAIDDPYGRAPAAPALQEVWFDIQIMRDLQKVVHNQGWPRVDIKIIEESVRNAAPQYVQSDPELLRQWLRDRLDDIGSAYDELQPDDSFTHYDSVEIGSAGVGGKMIDANGVIRVIERRMARALKQLPILMGNNEGTTETHGTVQWQIFAAGLESLRKPIAEILTRMLQVVLDINGCPATAECWFDPIRTTDRLLDAQSEQLEIRNSLMKYGAGLQSWEETAVQLTGSAPPMGAIAPDPASFGTLNR